MNRVLRRVTSHNWIGGVCGGIAYWLGVPTWAVRLIATLSLMGYGIVGIAYILLMIFMPAWPEDPQDYSSVTDDN